MATEFLRTLSDDERRKVEESDQPEWSAPMLATLTEDRFSDPEWIFERKLDGERALAFRRGDALRLLTRNRKQINDTYPEVADALSSQACSEFVVDGEVVAFSGSVTSFSRLQQRMQIKDREEARSSGIPVWFYAFDLMHLDGHCVENLSLRTRKKLLKRALKFSGPLRLAAHRNKCGEEYFKEACARGWEGVIAKNAQSRYQHSRSRDWLKFKCVKGQELVIGGFTEPEGERIGFGALLVGYYKGNVLHYAGKVGTGYDDDFLREFRERLDQIEREEPPFADGPKASEAIHWVEPRVVGEFEYTEWTEDGKLRHPRFIGLRRDKSPRKVVREEADN